MYKYAHDLPKQLDTDGKPIPKHDGIVEGWCLPHGLPSGTWWTRTTSATLCTSNSTRSTSPLSHTPSLSLLYIKIFVPPPHWGGLDLKRG